MNFLKQLNLVLLIISLMFVPFTLFVAASLNGLGIAVFLSVPVIYVIISCTVSYLFGQGFKLNLPK